MSVNPDYKELLSVFNEEGVEYLVVGAHAVIFYTVPRYTKDIDLWVNPTAENAARVYRALAKFGSPLEGTDVASFQDANCLFQIGVEPNRADVLMGVAGLVFEEAWSRRARGSYGGVPINILSLSDLIRSKEAVGRAQDMVDVQRLRKAKPLTGGES
ncbi:MAG TPA: nucleotidyltransferase [bacterium]|nr:nucleotidyltransferase [bacterium]